MRRFATILALLCHLSLFALPAIPAAGPACPLAPLAPVDYSRPFGHIEKEIQLRRLKKEKEVWKVALTLDGHTDEKAVRRLLPEEEPDRSDAENTPQEEVAESVHLARLAAELGLGPRVLALTERQETPHVSWYARPFTHPQPKTEWQLYVDFIPGVSFAEAGWNRNTLPPTLGEFKRQILPSLRANSLEFGYSAVHGFSNRDVEQALNNESYARLIKKTELLRDLHPDPTGENLLFVIKRDAAGHPYLDVVGIDWMVPDGNVSTIRAKIEMLQKEKDRRRGQVL
jgi:hypothetical protein